MRLSLDCPGQLAFRRSDSRIEGQPDSRNNLKRDRKATKSEDSLDQRDKVQEANQPYDDHFLIRPGPNLFQASLDSPAHRSS
jgi:hypothetical protein